MNEDYYLQIFKAKEVDTNNDEQVLSTLKEYEEGLSRSNAHVRLALDLLKCGDAFEQKLIKYIRPLVIKGVPSIIRTLRNLYKDSAKRDVIGKILHEWCANMESDRVLSKTDEDEQDPTVLLWLYYFLSQHNLLLNKPEEALNWINKAIEHTPTVSDLYLQKAKIFQFMGNREHASALAEEAFNLDTADRNLNFEASKYKLKNGEYDRANELMGLFSYDVIKGGDLNSHEMQTLWYECACHN